jgi:flagellar hook-associated protein 2
VIDLAANGIKTVGDLMNAINTSGVRVAASINATGNGILLTDLANAAGKLQVSDLTSTSAAALHLTGGDRTQIDGALRTQITIGASATLNDVVQSLANSGAPISASIINDGSGSHPFRLLLNSTQSGAKGRLAIDTGTSGIQLSTISQATDAVLGVGTSSSGGPNLLFSSATNTFKQVLPGLDIDIDGVSTDPVTVTVSNNTAPLVAAIQQFVTQFNQISSALTTATAYDLTTGKGAALHADPTTERLQNTLYNLATGQAGPSAGSIRSLVQLGITFKDGQLILDQNKLNSTIAADPTSAQNFFSDATVGLGAKLNNTLDQFGNQFNGQITNRVSALTTDINSLNDRITFLNKQLDNKRQLLQNQFLAMEQSLSQIQNQSSMISQIVNLFSTTSTTSSTGSTSSGGSSSSSSA